MIKNYIELAQNETRRLTEQDRVGKFKAAWNIYYGHGKKPLKADPSKDDDNVRFNLGREIIDKGVSFLFGKDITFELVEGETTPEEEYLEDVWRQNHKMSLLQKLATSGAVCGTAFVKIKWQLGLDPKLVLLDPETVHVTLAEDDIDTPVAYTIRYPTVDPDTGDNITLVQEITQDGNGWLITDKRGDSAGGILRVVGEQRWMFPFPPIVHCQNMIAPHEFWGMSDIEDDLVELIDKLNFVLANTLKIIRYHAHPRTWATGIKPEQVSPEVANDPTKMLLLPTAEARMQNLEMHSDLASSLETYRELKQAVHELSRVPEVSTGKVESIGMLSGVALEILYQPLLEKTHAKRVTYGELIVELNRRLLALNGMGDQHITNLHWQDLLPKDPHIVANAKLALKQLGVSVDTLLQELAYDPDKEREKRAKELQTLGEMLLRDMDAGGADAIVD